MRVIVNNISDTAAAAAGWRARAVDIPNKTEAPLGQVLKAINLKHGASMLDLITEGGKIKTGWLLYVNGVPLAGGSLISGMVKDSVQIHVVNVKIESHLDIAPE